MYTEIFIFFSLNRLDPLNQRLFVLMKILICHLSLQIIQVIFKISMLLFFYLVLLFHNLISFLINLQFFRVQFPVLVSNNSTQLSDFLILVDLFNSLKHLLLIQEEWRKWLFRGLCKMYYQFLTFALLKLIYNFIKQYYYFNLLFPKLI